MDLKELRLQVLIDPKLPPVSEAHVSFETGGNKNDRSRWSYNHHGLNFTPSDPGALTSFFEDLILGAPFPLVLGVHSVKAVDTVFAAAIFTDRSLAVHPSMPGLVSSVDLYHRYGASAQGHLSPDLGRFFRLLDGYFSLNLSREETGQRLSEGVAWVRDFVFEDRLPHIGGNSDEVRILDLGTNGFVVGECRKPSYDSWVDLYRRGLLRGVVFGLESEGQRPVLISKKSSFVSFDLGKASRLLSELEYLEGSGARWQTEGLFLSASGGGSVLLPSVILDVLIRC